MNEIYISIDENLKEIAYEHAQERLKFEYDRFRLSNEQRKSMIVIGSIGQLLFKKYLEEKNIDFKFEFQAGTYDRLDFCVNKKIIEIKSSGIADEHRHMNLLYTKDQFMTGIRKNFEYCVQIFINGYNKSTKLLDRKKCTTGILYGYIKFLQIKEFKNPSMKYYGDYYKVPLGNLKSIENLCKELEH